MDYLLLFGACVFFALQFVFQKWFEQRAKAGMAVCLWNILVSGGVAVLFLLVKAGLPRELNPTAFGIAVLYAASGLFCSIATISAMAAGPVSGIGVWCLAGGMILPFLYGVFFLGEPASIWKWLGMAILTLSLVPAVIRRDRKAKERANLRYVLWCAVIFLTNGFVSIFSKMHQISPAAVGEDAFVLTGSLLRCGAALFLILVSAWTAGRRGEKKPLSAAFYDIGRTGTTGKLFLLLFACAAAYSILNTLGNLLSLRCMNTLDASVQFPLLSATVTVLTALFGALFFREKLGGMTVLSLILTVVGAGLIAASAQIGFTL
ncbi:MAG: hypothetical protein K6A33_00490 [Clostridiales bacterium]|nr:hypothetical protein [Clostridiales bacterium]